MKYLIIMGLALGCCGDECMAQSSHGSTAYAPVASTGWVMVEASHEASGGSHGMSRREARKARRAERKASKGSHGSVSYQAAPVEAPCCVEVAAPVAAAVCCVQAAPVMVAAPVYVPMVRARVWRRPVVAVPLMTCPTGTCPQL